MSSSDKCTQPTCHMCSTRAGAPNSQSESRPNPATRWSGPACRDRTTLPKVPGEGLSPERLPRCAVACMGWQGWGVEGAKDLARASPLGCRQMGLCVLIKLRCAPQLPFQAPPSASEKPEEGSSCPGPHVIKGGHSSWSLGLSKPTPSSPFTEFLRSVVSGSAHHPFVAPRAPFPLFFFLITEVRCVYPDERNSTKI